MQGKIKEVTGQALAGIKTLWFEDGSSTMIDGGFGMRQLHSAFGNALRGKVIEYEEDEYGVMLSFEEVEDEG